MPDRKFRIRYGTWSPREAVVPAEKIGDDNGLEAVRLAMGHAFMEQLKGRWDDNADLQVVLDKSSPDIATIGTACRPTDASQARISRVLSNPASTNANATNTQNTQGRSQPASLDCLPA